MLNSTTHLCSFLRLNAYINTMLKCAEESSSTTLQLTVISLIYDSDSLFPDGASEGAKAWKSDSYAQAMTWLSLWAKALTFLGFVLAYTYSYIHLYLIYICIHTYMYDMKCEREKQTVGGPSSMLWLYANAVGNDLICPDGAFFAIRGDKVMWNILFTSRV